MRTPLMVLFLSIASCFPFAILADVRTTGDISGNAVTEDGESLPGATVTLAGEGLIQRSVIQSTNEKGYFRFLNLTPGRYLVTLSLQGFATRKYDVEVNVGSNKTIRVVMIPSTVQEQVDVVDEVPLIDASSPQISTNYTEETIQRIPIRREFIEFTDLAAGINDKGAYGAGGLVTVNNGKYVRGAATNSYRLNGVEVSNIDYGGTWVNPSFDTIDEIQVVGIGTSAEFGDYIGTAVNVVTKTGTNQYHGGVSYFYFNDDMQADNSDGVIDLTPQQSNYTNDFSVSLGGPILKDRLLFFANYGLNSYAVAPFDAEFFNSFWQDHYQLKMDWLANEKNNLSLMFNTDPASDDNLGLLAGSGPEIAYNEDFRTDTWFASWDSSINETTFVEAKYAGFNGKYSYVPVAPLDVPVVNDFTTGIKYGSYGFIGGDRNERDTITGNITHYADDFLKTSHSFKFGVGYENAYTQYDLDQSGGASFYAYSYGPYTIIGAYTYEAHTQASVEKFSVFTQDDIQVNEKMTLNLGLRYDRPTIRDEADGVDLNTYNFLAPRIGFSYDFRADGKNVAHFHYGRYFDKIMTYGTIFWAGTGFAPINLYSLTTDQPFDPTNTEILEQTLLPENNYATITPSRIPIDPELTGPNSDVINAGYETMVTDNFALSFDYVYKSDQDFIILTDRNQHTYEPFEYTNPFTNTTKTLYAKTDDLPTNYIISNDPFYKRNHHIAFVTLQTRQSLRWLLQGTLTYQRTTGTIENTEGAAYSIDFSRHTNPNFTQDPFNEGRLSFDRAWQFKLLGAYEMPWGFQFSGDYRLLSGRPWAPVTTSRRIPELNADAFYFVLLEPRGNRRWDVLNSLNLRLSKSFNLGSIGGQPTKVEAIIDVFNVFNNDSPEGINQEVYAVYPISGESSFGLPSSLIPPRRLRIGARFTF